jgi:hypothetical protein
MRLLSSVHSPLVTLFKGCVVDVSMFGAQFVGILSFLYLLRISAGFAGRIIARAYWILASFYRFGEGG